MKCNKRHGFVSCENQIPRHQYMKNKKNKIKEPFEPRDTPSPPQIIEPNNGSKRENPVKEDDGPENKGKTDGPADDSGIDDETTV